MTSRRPGARLIRIGLSLVKSAPSSARTRDSSVATGSRSRSRLNDWGGGWGGSGGCDNLRLLGLGLDDNPIEEPRLSRLEARRQHVASVRLNPRIFQLERVSAAGAVPARPLLGLAVDR